MKVFFIVVTTVLSVVISLPTYSQSNRFALHLKSGSAILPYNITDEKTREYNQLAQRVNGKSYCILQFESIPLPQAIQGLRQNGIRLLEYIPEKSYIAEISNNLTTASLKKFNARSIQLIQPLQKINPFLLAENNNNQNLDVLISLFTTVDPSYAIAALQSNGYSSVQYEYREYNILRVKIAFTQLTALAALPFIQYIEKVPPPPTPLNFDSRNNAKTNMVQSTLPGGLNLNGDSVVISVNESGAPQDHVDFVDRLINAAVSSTGDFHSTHVHGITGGNGIVNEKYKGYAPKAKLFNPFLLNPAQTPSDFLSHGVVITNNSYSTGGPCYEYIYSLQQFIADKQAIDYPAIQNVFAAGNSGTTICPTNHPAGYFTVERGFNSAKSTIGVGSTSDDSILSPFSSKGPTAGGRLKPEIVASGSRILSTAPNNRYAYNGGTSMSAPAVAGALALLYQRYKQLHNNVNPNSALMKAILCNTATDMGNPGPDFSYGFGTLNVYDAVKTINDHRYLHDSVSHQTLKTHVIQVPPGTSELKVLLYWQDPPAHLLANRALVNDLDIKLVSPSGNIILPYILDTTPANVINPAVRGEDHLNNIEQVVVNMPEAGNYTIQINGTEVAQNPFQPYFITYDIKPIDTRLTFPFGNESLEPGEVINILWDSWGQPNSAFSLSFSSDNGNTWQTINDAIPAVKRRYQWQLPAVVTNQALVKLTRLSDMKTSVSGAFTILAAPLVTLSAAQCPGYFAIEWNNVPGASHYEVMMKKQGEMITIDTTSKTSYIFRYLSEDSTYWVTARAIFNGSTGRRGIAVSRKPDSGFCTDTVSNNDLKADQLISPKSGRKFTSTQITDNHVVFRIKNLDNQPALNATLSYSVNNNPWISETVNNIPPNSVYTHTFTTSYDFSQPGEYTIRVAVHNVAADPDKNNDTLLYIIRNLDNPVINLTSPHIENFETVLPVDYYKSFMGLYGLDKFDFELFTGPGRLRFPMNRLSDTSGFSAHLDFPSRRGLLLQHLIGTFNLSSRNAATDQVGLKFNYRNADNCLTCGSVFRIGIRGNDTAAWIPVPVTKAFNSGDTVLTTEGMELGTLLTAAGQNFSSSVQVRVSISTPFYRYLVDDITLYDAADDVSVKSIDSIPVKSCGLSNVSPVRITIRNAASHAISIQAHYKIDGGNTITELIPAIAARSSLPFTFATPANLSGTGSHTIEAWVSYANDSYTDNNYKKFSFINQPVVSAFPYVENFETPNSAWFAEGQNSSWQYGTPSSPIINGAASGSKAWKTNLAGVHNSNESSYLYSPCIDYSALQTPVLSFSIALNTDSCYPYCDALRVQYSANGRDWSTIDATPPNNYNWEGMGLTSKKHNRWHVATSALPATPGTKQFRFFFTGDSINNYEGVAIDDIHIYDYKWPVYDTSVAVTSAEKNISGTESWVDFIQEQKIIASIHPRGQHLGKTILNPYIQNIVPVANFHGQYYLNRNFIIQSENKLIDSISVRFYFLDKEADSLLFAQTCPHCPATANAYKLGISRYTTPQKQEENNIISDNIQGQWAFIEPAAIKTVPYGKGYYIEFKTKDLSEFWINGGGLDKKSYLPLNILQFTGRKTAPSAALLEWTTASEINILRFDIEVARGNAAFEQNSFVKLAEVQSKGSSIQNTSYTFSDIAPDKNGAYYYRLKIIDEFGNYSYTRPIAIIYGNELAWKVFPNPSDGIYTLLYQLDRSEKPVITIYSIEGKPIHEQSLSGTGFIQQTTIDLKRKMVPKGIYLARIRTNSEEYTFKLIMQ